MDGGDAGKRLPVLVVEDESVVAMLIEDMLADIGHEVGAVASTLDAAMEQALTGSFDVAILDVNLDGAKSVAQEFRGLPLACDIASADSAEQAIAAARTAHGAARILVN